MNKMIGWPTSSEIAMRAYLVGNGDEGLPRQKWRCELGAELDLELCKVLFWVAKKA